MEVTPWILKQLIEKHGNELYSEIESIQSAEDIMANMHHIKQNKIILYNFLDKFLA
jgi:hypothetical protein